MKKRRLAMGVICLLFGAASLAAAESKSRPASTPAPPAESPKDARAANELGRTLLAGGDTARAVEWFEKSVSLEPENAEYHVWLGRGYGYQAMRASVLKQPGLARKVRREFETASRLDPDNLEARFALIEFYVRAPGILGGSLEKARSEAGEIRKRNALEGHRASGRIAELRKEPDQALEEYRQALAEFPESAEPSYWIGAFYARRSDYANAFEAYEKLLESDPGQMAVRYQIGRLASISGQNLELGEECLRRYLEHEPGPDEPSLASAHYHLGVLYEKTGNPELARREYSAALEIEPSLADARQALSRTTHGHPAATRAAD
jgi:tetratricopeptide (TPR) repeat protein